jgi:hypothetical protein
MRASSLVFLALGALVLGGCDSCSKPETTTTTAPSASVAAQPSASAAPSAAPSASAAAAGADAGAHPMTNCPTAVSGSETAIKDVEGGVEISVTAKDDAATKEIRDRAKKILEADKMDAGAHAQHNGSGMGGGTTGRCTIILRNTKLASAEIPGGVKVTVQPKDKSELDWLRRETRERDVEAKSKDSVGAGAKRMAHCASAVEGAKTTVKDTKDGVVVTITGPADKVNEIRDRAKHTAEVAKKSDAAKVQHSGEGTGGGGIGRCPIVVEGETSVELKEIPTGVEATVTTKKDVPALQKEAKERAANFK